MHKSLKAVVLFCLSLSAFFSSYQLIAKEQTEYVIETTQPAHHLMEVKATFKNVKGNELIVHLPTWRTGKYKILEFAKDVRHFKAFEGRTDQQLAWKKINKASWKIELEHAEVKDVTVQYEIYANELGLRTKHLDDSHLFFDAASVLMYTDQHRDSASLVKLKLPKGWKTFSGLTKVKKKRSRKYSAIYKADNYDQLADSPIEAGTPLFKKFEVDGKNYELVIWGHGNYNVVQIIDDTTKIIKETVNVWQTYPFERYVFMIHATDGARGATEHINSTIIQRHRFKFGEREDYIGFIRTVTHEFVHTWNVKQYRPEGVRRYDFQHENYSELYWMAEGSTSYYDGLITARAGVITKKEYLKSLAKEIHNYKRRPGSKVMTAAEASFDTWILNESKDRATNASVNIYSQGELLSLALDIKIRAATQGKKGFEDVHRLMYENHRLPEKSYSNQDVIDAINQLTGQDFTQWYRQHVLGTKTVDWETLVNQIGLKFSYKPKPGLSKQVWWSGIDINNETQVIRRVEKDSPAWQAGLTTGDKIIAINGYQLQQPLSDWLKLDGVQTPIKLSYFRRGMLHETEVKVVKIDNGKPVLEPIDTPTDDQKQLFESWLGIPLTAESSDKAEVETIKKREVKASKKSED